MRTSKSRKISKKVSSSKQTRRPLSFIDQHFWLIVAVSITIAFMSLLVIKKVEFHKKQKRSEMFFQQAAHKSKVIPSTQSGQLQYINISVGFSFEFPEGYKQDNGGENGMYFSVQKSHKTEDEVWPVSKNDLKLEFWFFESVNSLDDFVVSQRDNQFQKQLYQNTGYTELNREMVTLGGKEWLKITGKTNSGMMSDYYLVYNKIGIHLLKQPEDTELLADFDKIVSSFYFN